MKMPQKGIDPSMFAPCGMNCMVCYKHCCHPRPCAGCQGGEDGKPIHCRSCKIKECARERGVSYCFACGGYPCERVKNLEKSYRTRYGTSLMENGRLVKEEGLSVFLRRQEEQYTCPDCGGVISLHDRECSECQRKITAQAQRGGADEKNELA